MAEHVEIVIKISEKTYAEIMAKDATTKAEAIICNGKRLPKGHGNLIDTKEITAFRELECNGRNVESLDEFTTIIEANKEG